jgi:hypothetical protein
MKTKQEVRIKLDNLKFGKDVLECLQEGILEPKELNRTEKIYVWFYILSLKAQDN